MVKPGATEAEALQAEAWRVASSVPDPELPYLTIGELGMVAAVRVLETGVGGDTLEVDLTPTYTGCPAVQVIEASVVNALREAGIPARVRRVLSPAWSTDRITESGREKMRANGIAPPHHLPADEAGDNPLVDRSSPADAGATPTVVNIVATLFQDEGGHSQSQKTIECPYCGAHETRRVSVFGSTPCKSQFQCDDCHEPFEYFKCH